MITDTASTAASKDFSIISLSSLENLPVTNSTK